MYSTYLLYLVENLLRNVSTDSRLSWSEHPNRISAVQFQDDVIDHEDKPAVFHYILSPSSIFVRLLPSLSFICERLCGKIGK